MADLMAHSKLRGEAVGVKRSLVGEDCHRPLKKTKALLEDEDISDGESSTSNGSGGIAINGHESLSNGQDFKINEAYAKRFEHNKKREELQWRESKFDGLSRSCTY